MNKETIEGDFKISLFMGYTYPDIENEAFKVSYNDLHKYSNDWRLLMPVVEKINSDENVAININKDEVFLHINGWGMKRFNNTGFGSKIGAVYESCKEAIEWYNSQSK